jgi:glycosyltransferase involved in cell wall biosynthesis
MPLRILHLTAASDAGGLSRYLLDLTQGLRSRGHQVTIAGGVGPWHDRFAAAAIPWIDLPLRGGPIGLFRAVGTLRQYLAQNPTDILHTHYRKPTLVARRVAGQFKIPILYTVHQPRINLAGPWGWLSDFGDHVHAPSQDARRWLIDDAKVPEERITVIPHGIDAARFPLRDAATKAAARALLGISPTITVAAFVGRLDVPKNADWMLDVAQASRSALPDLKIILTGDGPQSADLHRAVEQKNLSDRVLLLGERDALPVYQAADALLSPSLREGFGLACAEAMCVGVPVLRTRTGGAEEMIHESVTGRGVPVDRAAFTAAAVEFLADRSALEKMGQAAGELIRREFTLDQQIDRTIALYKRLRQIKSR